MFGVSPERGHLQFGVFFCDFNGVIRETQTQVVQWQERVVEVQSRDLVGHFGVVGTPRVTVAEDNVMQPVRDNTLSVHQISDGL